MQRPFRHRLGKCLHTSMVVLTFWGRTGNQMTQQSDYYRLLFLSIKITTHQIQCKFTNNWACIRLVPVSPVPVAISIAITIPVPILSMMLVTIKDVNSLPASGKRNSFDAQSPVFIWKYRGQLYTVSLACVTQYPEPKQWFRKGSWLFYVTKNVFPSQYLFNKMCSICESQPF